MLYFGSNSRQTTVTFTFDYELSVVSGIPLTDKSGHGQEESLLVKVYKDLVNVKFSVGGDSRDLDFAGSVGVTGSWKNGTRLARDGATVLLDNDAFGQEWQVNDQDPMFLMTNRAPQFPTKCEMPTTAITMMPTTAVTNLRALRLAEGISKESAEGACGHLLKGHGFEQCVYDVLATQELAAGKDGAY